MHNVSLRGMHLLAAIAAAGSVLGGVAAVYALLCRTPSPDEQEASAASSLVRQGRIIDGTVIDISDLNAEESGRPQGMQLILYKYDIAGVVTSARKTLPCFGTWSISTTAGSVFPLRCGTIRTIRATL